MKITKKRLMILFIAILITIPSGYLIANKLNINPTKTVGEIVDSFNDVNVYYNGGVGHVLGRNLTADGYNLGLKYQCVEFIKRYYYERFHLKMPDSMGHAKSFYNPRTPSGTINKQRGLLQLDMTHKPEVEDIIIFQGTLLNPYGHVAIITKVKQDFIEIIQQNPGPFGKSRINIALKKLTVAA